MHTPRRPRGFTLLELLVVVVILGVLTLVAVPIFRSFTSSANSTAALSSARNIADQANAQSLNAGEDKTYMNGRDKNGLAAVGGKYDIEQAAIGAGLTTTNTSKTYYTITAACSETKAGIDFNGDGDKLDSSQVMEVTVNATNSLVYINSDGQAVASTYTSCA